MAEWLDHCYSFGGLVPSTRQSRLQFQVIQCTLLDSVAPCTHVVHIYTWRQSIHTHETKFLKIFKERNSLRVKNDCIAAHVEEKDSESQ